MIVHLKNFRKGLATNSSSTHTIIYRNKEELFKDLNVFELDYYDRFDSTIAASREAKIKYVLSAVFRHSELVNLLVGRYPEMKEYFPLIKEQMRIEKEQDWEKDSAFGQCPRGRFSNEDLYFSFKFCCDVIDDDEKIIIGGSDEEDFVYDMREGHAELEFPGRGITKNGNYYYVFGHSNPGKIRFTFDKENPIPEYPELVDLKITGKCDHGCPMCFNESGPNGKHANIDYLESFIKAASNYGNNIVEYSIGGGNILLYPNLERLFSTIKQTKGYVNVTIKADDVKRVMEDKNLTDLFKTYVDGCGISVFNEKDIEIVRNFKEFIDYDVYVVAHIIPEYIGFDMTMKIIEKTKGCVSLLFLGYKELGRGKNRGWHKFTDDELKKIFDYPCIHIDTLFGQRYHDWISANYETNFCYTQNEGEYSVYLDAVTETVYMSSYNLEKPYKLQDSYLINEDYKKIFDSIRKDNGFQTSNEIKHYWDLEK